MVRFFLSFVFGVILPTELSVGLWKLEEMRLSGCFNEFHLLNMINESSSRYSIFCFLVVPPPVQKIDSRRNSDRCNFCGPSPCYHWCWGMEKIPLCVKNTNLSKGVNICTYGYPTTHHCVLVWNGIFCEHASNIKSTICFPEMFFFINISFLMTKPSPDFQ